MKYQLILHCLAVFLGLCVKLPAQGAEEYALQEILRVLDREYVLPAVARRMQDSLQLRLDRGHYAGIAAGEPFAVQLTSELRELSGDLHLSVLYRQEGATDSPNAFPESEAEVEGWLTGLLRENNYGVSEKAILDGNIGYLKIPLFGPLDRCLDTLAAAMAYVAETEALIFDLRECRGSLDPHTIPFFSGYFFAEPVHLFDFYTRSTDETRQFWTSAWVPGRRYIDKPIFVLTSGRTFSGGEEFAYDLQQLGRATVVGDTTRGGANPNKLVEIGERYALVVPYMRSVNPVSGTNWEQIGVYPNVPSPAYRAQYDAQLLALDTLLATSRDASVRARLEQIKRQLEKHPPILKSVIFELPGYQQAGEVIVTGSFNAWDSRGVALHRQGDRWVAEVQAPTGKLSYKFIVDGEWILDPLNPRQEKQGDYTNSVRYIE